MNTAKEYKYMINIKTKHSGLCDRIRVIIIGVYLLDKLGQDAGMVVNWDKKALQCCCDFKDLFMVPERTVFTSSGSKVEEASIHIKYDESEFKKYNGITSYVRTRDDLWELQELLSRIDSWNALQWTHHFDIEYTIEGDNIILTLMNMEDRYIDLDKNIYYKLLRPTNELRERIGEMTKRFRISKDVIGIHMRGTDKNEVNGVEFVENEINSIRLQIGRILEQNPSQKFLFCTEDKAIEDRFLQRFGSNLIILPDKHYIFHLKGQKRTRENLKDAVVELWLLSMCNYNDKVKLRSNSHFTRFPGLIKQRGNNDI